MRFIDFLRGGLGGLSATTNPLSSRTLHLAIFGGALVLVPLTGCPDPEGKFNDFTDRYNAIHNDQGGSGGAGGAAACTPTMEGEADGKYLFALSSNIAPKKAFALDATVVTHAAADGLTLDITLQPLSGMDQMTPVGDPLTFTALPVGADGHFDWDLSAQTGGSITLVKEANPITPFDVESTLQLHGDLCGADRLGFICGTVTGVTSKPLVNHDLSDGDGSAFTMTRYDTTLPAPVINCAGDPAEY